MSGNPKNGGATNDPFFDDEYDELELGEGELLDDDWDDEGFEEEATRVFSGDPEEEEMGEEATVVWSTGAAGLAGLHGGATTSTPQASYPAQAQPSSVSVNTAGLGVQATPAASPAPAAAPAPAQQAVPQPLAAGPATVQVRAIQPSQAAPAAGGSKGMVAALAALLLVVLALGGAFLMKSGGEETFALAIDSEPRGAEVFLNGEDTGKRTPATLPGIVRGTNYVVRLEHAGYESLEEFVNVAQGDAERVTFTLETLTLDVRVETEPAGASVFLDGEEKGLSPLVIEDLDPSQTYTLTTELEGFVSTRQLIDWEAGDTENKALSLALEASAPAEGEEALAEGEEPAIDGETPTEAAEAAPAAAAAAQPSTTRSSTRSSSRTSRSTSSAPAPPSAPSRPTASAPPTRPGASAPPTAPSRPSASAPPTAPSRPSASAPPTSPSRPSASAPPSRPSASAPPSRPSASAAAPAATGPGTLSVAATPFGQVWVDGRMVAPQTPMMNYELSPGTHTVKVYFVPTRTFSDERTVRIESGEATRIRFRGE